MFSDFSHDDIRFLYKSLSLTEKEKKLIETYCKLKENNYEFNAINVMMESRDKEVTSLYMRIKNYMDSIKYTKKE